MKITTKETQVILNLVMNEYTEFNGSYPSEPVLGGVWSWSIWECGAATIVNPKGIGGIVSSLVKKGLAWTDSDVGDDSATGLTEEGFKVFTSLFPNREAVDTYLGTENKKLSKIVPEAIDVPAEVGYDIDNLNETENKMTNTVTSANRFGNNIGPLFNGLGKSEITRRIMMGKANDGTKLNIEKFGAKLGWTVAKTREALNFHKHQVNCKLTFKGSMVTISWK